MTFAIEDKWVWDFWFAVADEEYHMFYLQADKSLKDPELRHWNVSIGHAVSTDLKSWRRLPDALAPSREPTSPDGRVAADSCTTWTGSVFKHEDTWYMVYTGTSTAEEGKVQRVCLATSADLVHWDKHPGNPLVQLDARWYDGLDLERWHDASWRDPWIVKDPEKDLFHMYVTCRVNTGPNDGRGAIGHAQSANLLDWEVSAPILAPGAYGEMEVPQVEKIGEYYYLFCSVSEKHTSALQREKLAGKPLNGVLYYISDSIHGPYRTIGSGYLFADHQFSLYSGKVVRGPDGQWHLMGFLNNDEQGNFIGEISAPMPINVAPDGVLTTSSTF